MSSREQDLARIEAGLKAAGEVLVDFTPGAIEHRKKAGGDPVTEADLAVNRVLLERLPAAGEGWLSEETVDEPSRLGRDRVWVVDPVDGTREFVAGIPEWCVSVGLVEHGRAVAGGILIPARKMLILGSLEGGVTLNGDPRTVRPLTRLAGARALASRSEVRRGEWTRFEDGPLEVEPTGSVAMKLGLVAAGEADLTFTLVPKHEWDVCAGVALVNAAGGTAWIPGGSEPVFNQADPKLPGLIAAPAALADSLRGYLEPFIGS